MEKRIGVVGIVIENKDNVQRLNGILSEFSDIIVGRMGIPYEQKGFSVISLIVDGTTDDIGALTGKIGSLHGITVKTAVSKITTQQ